MFIFFYFELVYNCLSLLLGEWDSSAMNWIKSQPPLVIESVSAGIQDRGN